MARYIIEVRQLAKTHRGTPAVGHLDLRTPEGFIFGFLGPNGASKSTTMKMLLGLVNRDSRNVRTNGIELNGYSRIPILGQVDPLIETPSHHGNPTACENLQISCMLRDLSHMEVDRVLSIVHLDGQKKKQTTNYSLGIEQRLGLTDALLGSPKLALLGEPTDGLDPAGIHETRELIKNLPERFRVTVMASSYLLAEVEQTADRIDIISRGRLIFQGALSTLRACNTQQIYLHTPGDTDTVALLRKNGELSALLRGNEDRAALLLKRNDAADGSRYSATDGIRLPFLPDHMLAQMFHILMNHGTDLYQAEEKR